MSLIAIDDVELRGRFDEAQRDALELADRLVEMVEHEIGLSPELARAAVNYRQQRTLMRRLRALAREEGGVL
jgi:hypothetical protein